MTEQTLRKKWNRFLRGKHGFVPNDEDKFNWIVRQFNDVIEKPPVKQSPNGEEIPKGGWRMCLGDG